VIEAPDFSEPFEAWRAWRVVEQNGVLQLLSMVQRTLWPVGEPLTAECLHGRSWLRRRLSRGWDHEVPATRCQCGIYGATLERSGVYLNSTPKAGVGRVFGRVSLWGVVIECQHGFRASTAYPALIYVTSDAHNYSEDGWSEIAFGLQRYRVPIEPLFCRARDAVAAVREQCIAAA
jgi:hypothetical protein